MFDELSVAENIFMGHMPLARRRARRLAQDEGPRAPYCSKRLEADFDAGALLKTLGVAQKHLVEIARALSHDANIIIMDEPTSALSAHEIGDLFLIIEQLKKHDCAILFISHKFDEIFQRRRPLDLPARRRRGRRRRASPTSRRPISSA